MKANNTIITLIYINNSTCRTIRLSNTDPKSNIPRVSILIGMSIGYIFIENGGNARLHYFDIHVRG